MDRTAATLTRCSTDPFIFASFADADRLRVLTIAAALEQAGVAVWLDQLVDSPLDIDSKETTDRIERCAVFMFMCSAASFASPQCRQALMFAWKRQRPLLPLLLVKTEVPKDAEYWLGDTRWVEILNHPAETWLPSVLRALSGLGYPIAPTGESQTETEIETVGPADQASARRPAPIFGRQKQISETHAVLDAMFGGRGSTLLISGEAGVGKTAFVETVAYDAHARDAIVLTGHCYDLATTPPYGPWVEAMQHYVPGPGSAANPLRQVSAGGLVQIPSREALYIDVVRFLMTISQRRPVVVVLEDLHWADPSTVDLLGYVAHQIGVVRVLVVGTYRVDDLPRHHPLAEMLPILGREPGALRLRLDQLEDDVVRSLINARYQLSTPNTERLVTYVQLHAQGNALFIHELLRTLEDDALLVKREDGWELRDLRAVHVPPLVTELIEARVARLPEETQAALELASVIGQEVPIDVWKAVGGETEDELLETIIQAEQAHLLTSSPSGARLSFSHPLIREALYETVQPIRRRAWHKLAGEVMASSGRAEPSIVAYHFRQALDPRAVEWLMESGKRAEQVFALVSAASEYDEALQLALEFDDARGQAHARAAIGDLLRKQGRYDEATAFLKEARSNFEALSDQSGIALALQHLGTVAAHRGEMDLAAVYYQDSLAIRQALNDQPRIAGMLNNLGILARANGDIDRALGWHQEALSIRKSLDDSPAIAQSLNNLANTMLDHGELATARTYLEEAVAIQRRGDDPWSLANGLNNLGNVLREQGDSAAAHRLYDESLKLAEKLGDSFTFAFLFEDVATLLATEGELERALRLLQAASRLRQEIGLSRTPSDQKRLASIESWIRARLDPLLVSAAEAAGAGMNVDEAIIDASVSPAS